MGPHSRMEGGAGFEPAASCCAAGVLPEALPARIAATVDGVKTQRSADSSSSLSLSNASPLICIG